MMVPGIWYRRARSGLLLGCGALLLAAMSGCSLPLFQSPEVAVRIKSLLPEKRSPGEITGGAVAALLAHRYLAEKLFKGRK